MTRALPKRPPQFTWFTWGKGAEHFGPDSRERCASILRWARKDRRFNVELLSRGFYRVTKDDVMALIRTRWPHPSCAPSRAQSDAVASSFNQLEYRQ